jgi:hypothetical protein
MTSDSGRALGPKDSQGTAVDGLRVAAEFAQAVHMPAASASWLALSVPERGVFGSSNNRRQPRRGEPLRHVAVVELVRERRHVPRCHGVQLDAGHAKFASKTETLRAPTGDPSAANGHSAAIAEAGAVGAPRTAAIALW